MLVVVLVCCFFACVMAVGSSAWFIKVFGSKSLEASKSSATVVTSISDPYFTAVPIDNIDSNGDETTYDGYFTSTVTTYNGSPNELKITDTGAQALFGVSAADAAGKYEVQWLAGIYRYQENGKDVAINEAGHREIFAGRHYYRIIDTETGQVIFNKYQTTIGPDALIGTVLSDAYFDGDSVKSLSATLTAATTGEPVVKQITYPLSSETAVFNSGSSISNTSDTLTVPKTALTNAVETDANAAVILNNFDLDSIKDATGTYTVLARVYSHPSDNAGNKTYYGSLTTALGALKTAYDNGSSTAATVLVAMPEIDYGGKTYSSVVRSDKTTTVFSHEITESCEISPNVTLWIPFDPTTETLSKNGCAFIPTVRDGATIPHQNTFNMDADGNGAPDYRRNLVTVKPGVVLTNNGNINISAEITGGNGGTEYAGMVSRYYAELQMQSDNTNGASNITSKSASNINCYGFITKALATATDSNPNVDMESGSKITTLFTIREHRGGSAFTDLCGGLVNVGLNNVKPITSPFNQFFIQSVSADVNIEYGATLIGMYDLQMDSNDVPGEITIIGTSSNSFLQMKKEPDKEAGKVKLTFDTAEQKNKVEVRSDATVNPLNVSVNIKGMERTISTKDIYLPISHYWHIDFMTTENGEPTTVSMPVQRVKILPGGYIKAHEGVTATAKALAVYNSSSQIPPTSTYSHFIYPDKGEGTLIINGSLTVTEAFGGRVLSENEGAKIQIASASATSTELQAGADASKKIDVTHSAHGKIHLSDAGAQDSAFIAGRTYSSHTDNAWYLSAINITYNDGQTTATKTVYATSPGYELAGNNYVSGIPAPTYYSLEGLYTDPLMTSSALNNRIYGDTTLYVKWQPITYTTKFVAIDPDGNENATLPMPNGASFTAESANVLSSVVNPTHETYNFEGWYTDKACTNKVSSITGLELLNMNNGNTLYGKWSKDTVYTINYQSHNGVYEDITNGIVSFAEGESVPSLKSVGNAFETDRTKQYYFLGWKLNGEGDYFTGTIEELIANNPGTEEFTFVGYWQIKDYELTIKCNNGEGNGINIGEKIYFNEADKATVYTEYTDKAKASDSVQTVSKNFVGWKNASNNDVTSASGIVSGDTLTAQYEDKLKITLDITEATVTVGNTSYTSADTGKTIYISNGDVLKVSVSYNQSDGREFKIDGVTHTSGNNYTFTKDVTIRAYSKSCIAAGTLITLADGSVKKVEDLLETDILLVFDHESGKFVEAPILFIERDGWREYNVINLKFSDGRITRLIYEHALFDVTLNKYVYITEENLTEFIGHEFAVADGGEIATVTLEEAFVTTEYTGCYSLVTAYHLNYFIDGLFSIPGGIEGLFNIFEYGDGLKYDEEMMQADIEKYGLYTYEDFREYIPEEIYNAFPAAYFKVSVGKGYVTFEQIIGYIETYLVRNGLV